MHKLKCILPILVFCICLSLSEVNTQGATIIGQGDPAELIEVDTEFAGGTGTEDDPYLISDADQLELYRNYYGTFGQDINYFALTNDIYLNDNYKSYEKWGKNAPKNILSEANGYLDFSSLDGRGHTIYGMYADGSSFLPNGKRQAEIKNINFSHFYCKNTALLANYFSGTYAGNINISNGIIEFDEPTDRDSYGGVFLDATTYPGDAQILESININADMTVNQSGNIGLIAGSSSSSEIKNCSASGSLTYRHNSGSTHLGGLFGICGSISKCTNNAEIIATLPASKDVTCFFGGVAGHVRGTLIPQSDNECYPVTVASCKNTGSITVNTKYTIKFAEANKLLRQYYNVGGIVAGTGKNTTIKNCTNKGDIKAAFGNYIAGIVAELKGNISNCLNTGKLTGDSNYLLAGVAAEVSGNITHCENRGNITSVEQMVEKSKFFVSASVSGVVASIKSSGDGIPVAVKYCKNTGNITVTDDSQWAYAAGIAVSTCYDVNNEKATSISVTYCYNTGKLTAPVIGGIVASSSGAAGKNNTIKYCVNAGDLHQPFNDYRYAGICVFNSYTEVTNCYNLGKMTSDYSNCRERTGQIVGMNNNNSIVKKCYLLNTAANSMRGIGLSQTGATSSGLARKTKATMLKYKTVQKIIKNAGYKKP